jgi:transcriptional regulator with XRE-family HTH domain
MALNLALKFAIIESGRSQVELASALGMQDSRLSKIVNGHFQATEDEQRAIAHALGKPVDQLFPEVAA